MASPAAFTGFGELILKTTDGSGPAGDEGGYFPFPTSFSVTKETEIVDKFAFKPCGGTGVKQKVASFQGQQDWNGTMSIGVYSFLDLQLIYGQKAQTKSLTYPDVKCAIVASGVITDAALSGLDPEDVVVTWSYYDSTAGAPIQLIVVPSPDTASATEVVLDNSANTLTFAAQFEGQEIFYSIVTTASKRVIGASSPTLIKGLEFYGVINTNGNTTSAGYGIYIPSLTLDGSFAINLTGGDDEVEIPFSPVLAAGYSEPVVIIEL
jgi:hypothetical protein